ncbi:glutamate racemase [Tumebacillus permanentifrigoris]|uniref:Glutamate racemase n=1 Tax=Tumebacillus permanentifrigoris TaxID=378543 RepID=A0A316DGY9_9BACL|nr:glutamate racemase [Tumebacillus permanentifrigoris]PWK15843.1 glutamate racemase [Tumebacillus permanentifrigoris]
MCSTKPIGILDSGFGGLTVVGEVIRQLPQENILYVGDNARCPYGSRPPEEVRKFLFEIIDFLVAQEVKMIIIACNTATAAGLEEARQRYSVPVIGVIVPGSRAAISATKSGRIGVIGTENTINSDAYRRELHRINPRLTVTNRACKPFVRLVEEDLTDTEEARRTVTAYLQPIQTERIDTLILGCTHYPLLAPVIAEVMGEGVALINSAEETAREASTVLSVSQQLHDQNPQPQYKFYTTGDTEYFRQIGGRWLHRDIEVASVALGG